MPWGCCSGDMALVLNQSIGADKPGRFPVPSAHYRVGENVWKHFLLERARRMSVESSLLSQVQVFCDSNPHHTGSVY